MWLLVTVVDAWGLCKQLVAEIQPIFDIVNVSEMTHSWEVNSWWFSWLKFI